MAGICRGIQKYFATNYREQQKEAERKEKERMKLLMVSATMQARQMLTLSCSG